MNRLTKGLLLAVMAIALTLARPSRAIAECGEDHCSEDQWGCEVAARDYCLSQNTTCYEIFDERCFYEQDPETGDPCYTGYSCQFTCCDSGGGGDLCGDFGCHGGLCPLWCE
jgi:hypothetical protein